MHFSRKTTAALVAFLSISGSLAVPVGDGPHRVVRRSKCTKVKSIDSGTGSVASTNTNPPPEDTSGGDASGFVAVPNPTEANSSDGAAVSNDTPTPPEGASGTDNPPAAGQPDSSLNLSSDEVGKETDSEDESSDDAPVGNDAPSDDKSVPEEQSQEAAAPEVQSNGETPADTSRGTDQTQDEGFPEPSTDVGEASKGADAGETVQALSLSSNLAASNGEAKAKNSNGNPSDGDKAGSSIGKAGLGWNNDSGKRWDQFTKLEGTQVGWSYNWASGKNEKGNHPEGINYVPMLHGKATPGVDDKPALFETNKAKFKDWGVTHILSFNEPDMPIGDVGGSAMTVEEAVALHQRHLTPLASQFKIGGPAYSQGKLDDLKKWETQCAGKCAFDFVSLHFYGTDVKSLKGYLDEAAMKFPGKPLWMTEIGCISYGNPTKYCSNSEVVKFMKDAIPLLRERTERYAWQGSFDHFPNAPADRNNMMDPGTFEINEKGKIFATTA